jgi:hypothetical protein
MALPVAVFYSGLGVEVWEVKYIGVTVSTPQVVPLLLGTDQGSGRVELNAMHTNEEAEQPIQLHTATVSPSRISNR